MYEGGFSMPKTIEQSINDISYESILPLLKVYWSRYVNDPDKVGVPYSIFLLANIGCIADDRNSDNWEKFSRWYLQQYVQNGYKDSAIYFTQACFYFGIADKNGENIMLILEGYNASTKRVPGLIKWLETLGKDYFD